jgi:hypothetical protein
VIEAPDTKGRMDMVERVTIREKLLELEKLSPELLEEAMSFIEYLIHREKEKQNMPGIYDTDKIKFLSND